jgi:type III restriction enzyme
MASIQPPIQPVERPILCGPYEEPTAHWEYDRTTGIAAKMPGRRPAEYWYRDKTTQRGQAQFEYAEGREELVIVNQLRADVAHWRSLNYEGVTPITRELLQHWRRTDRSRRLFFCQLEAVETVIYLAEILRSNRKPRFKPQFQSSDIGLLHDGPGGEGLEPLVRMCCKMATGSGKTVVMAMLISWAFCNRGRNPSDERFPNGVLVCCPNLTVKERLQVLRPDIADNYYEEFDMVPHRLRPLIQAGRVLVTNWHAFAPKSEHSEGDKSYVVVNKGEETNEAFARDRLGELFERLPIMVLNDEAHHCYRPKAIEEVDRGAKEENEEATIWIEGLDKINNSTPGKRGVSMCVDLSATPFYIAGSGYAVNSPFPWLTSDFGLVDAIESGITKIPRMPVQDTTGRPDPKYFRLWEAIDNEIEPGQRLPGRARKPKPEVVYEKAQGALIQLSRQWKERWEQIQQASPGQERVPPVMIIVCDNIDIAEVFFRKISGESVEEVTTLEEVVEVLGSDDDDEEVVVSSKRSGKKAKPKITFGASELLIPEFANTAERKHTIRIDSKLLAEAETDEQNKTRPEAAEALRRVVSTVGKRGEPGEHIRCVVSVAMLTEGWDANNVTHILGLRAFTSQLLCEQVVGRGLRRMDYTPDRETGLLTEEYVDVYGIPFSVVPFKGRAIDKPAPEDRPKNHVMAVPERVARDPRFEIRFPVVDGFAFALKRNLLVCDVAGMDKLVLEPNREPVATFLAPTVGYQEGSPSQGGTFGFAPQDRQSYYRDTHLQTIKFQVAKLLASDLSGHVSGTSGAERRVLGLQSRHQLFPQLYRFVDEYVRTRVDFHGCNPCELGLERYVRLIVERLRTRIQPDASQGEPPLMPLLNRYKPIGTSAEVDFKTTRPCWATEHSHINQVVLDTDTWESSTAFGLEQLAHQQKIICYVRNDHLGLVIPYEYQGIDHSYEPDFLVRASDDHTVILETKGFIDNQTRAKHDAAGRWVSAANNWGELGRWSFYVCRDPHELAKGLMGLK